MSFVINPDWLMSIHWPLLRSVHSHKATKDGWIGRNGKFVASCEESRLMTIHP
jgi:hypothetical protein